MKKTLVLGAGAAVGVWLAPIVLTAVNIQPAPGFGVDDIVTAAIVVAAVMLVDAII